MPSIPCFQVDAFTRVAFQGNPAAVCLLDEWLSDELMQAIAFENALSETAFCVRVATGRYGLRWFTPAIEVDLCGHATLATAHVLLQILEPEAESLTFETLSGELRVIREEGGEMRLDFPARPPQPAHCPPELELAIGVEIKGCWLARDVVLELDSAEAVRSVTPNLAAIAAIDGLFAVCITAEGSGRDADVDFVSRFFAPAKGVPEDPVTGSAHCSLVPLWARRLGRDTLRARQVGPRPGDLLCTLSGDRVHLTGSAVTVKRGLFVLP